MTWVYICITCESRFRAYQGIAEWLRLHPVNVVIRVKTDSYGLLFILSIVVLTLTHDYYQLIFVLKYM